MASAAFKYTSPKQQTTFAFSSNISCQKVVPVYGVGIPEFAEPLCGVLVPAVNYPAVHLEIYKYSLLLLDRSPRVRALNKYTAQSHALKYTAPVQIFFAGNALHIVGFRIHSAQPFCCYFTDRYANRHDIQYTVPGVVQYTVHKSWCTVVQQAHKIHCTLYLE